jgi:hypothetical protein
MPIARRPHRRPRYDDDDEILRDGETFHARVTMMGVAVDRRADASPAAVLSVTVR